MITATLIATPLAFLLARTKYAKYKWLDIIFMIPFMTTILKNAILNIGNNLEESGATSGGGFFYRMRRITLPLLKGNYAIAMLLVFVKTLSEYGTPAIFGNLIQVNDNLITAAKVSGARKGYIFRWNGNGCFMYFPHNNSTYYDGAIADKKEEVK